MRARILKQNLKTNGLGKKNEIAQDNLWNAVTKEVSRTSICQNQQSASHLLHMKFDICVSRDVTVHLRREIYFSSIKHRKLHSLNRRKYSAKCSNDI